MTLIGVFKLGQRNVNSQLYICVGEQFFGQFFLTLQRKTTYALCILLCSCISNRKTSIQPALSAELAIGPLLRLNSL